MVCAVGSYTAAKSVGAMSNPICEDNRALSALCQWVSTLGHVVVRQPVRQDSECSRNEPKVRKQQPSAPGQMNIGLRESIMQPEGYLKTDRTEDDFKN